MTIAFEVATVLIVAVAMAQSLAHVLEYPGKMRLSKEEYLAVQPIYYPASLSVARLSRWAFSPWELSCSWIQAWAGYGSRSARWPR